MKVGFDFEIPLYRPEPAIHWNQFIDLVEEKYGFSHRCFYPSIYSEEGKAYKREWMKANDFDQYEYCLNRPKGSNADWPKESFEIQKRVEINTAWRESGLVEQWDKKYPYVDYWHIITDRYPIHNGCYFSLFKTNDLEVTAKHQLGDHYQVVDKATVSAYVNAIKTMEDAIFEAGVNYVTNDYGVESLYFWVEW